MTGLNLETFLHLLRADLGAWTTLGLIALVLALMTWTSWGSRRALRKCLVLSVAAHLGLALYGSTLPVESASVRSKDARSSREHIQRIQVTPRADTLGGSGKSSGRGRGGDRVAPWDRARDTVSLNDPKVIPIGPDTPRPLAIERSRPPDAPAPKAAPELNPTLPSDPGERTASKEIEAPPTPPQASPGDPGEVAAPVIARNEPGPGEAPPVESRLQPEHAPKVESPVEAAPKPSDRGVLPVLAPPSETANIEARPDAPKAVDPERSLIAPSPAPERDVAAPEVVKAGPSSSALADRNLRSQIRRPVTEGGREVVGAERSPRPEVPVATGSGAVVGPVVGEVATTPARPRERLAGSGDVTPKVTTDLATPEAAPEAVKRSNVPVPSADLPEADLRGRSRSEVPRGGSPTRMTEATGPIALTRVTPNGLPRLPEIQGTAGGRPLSDVPEVYRSRLDPNRSALAQRAGANAASEQAVERALDWLARHQDADGRWDAGIARFDDGSPQKGDDDFTVHCPPGETCFGECLYWEADTAVTGLSLLAYLGAGYTQTDGKYADTVGKGLDFLLATQKPDGDLRGRSRAVGMYCHAMATLALCEAYALTGDERLRGPVERAIDFIIKARARDGLAWRYSPQAPFGDTSILGWVVMALKSAKVVGVPIPATVHDGVLGWLGKVASGPDRGLASYVTDKPPTPTMTAEAWVCRQFLGVGGPGPASNEAADALLAHGPGRDPYNLYYWYYGTLAMYQHGGEAWSRWNGQVRDQIVRRQQTKGHKAGSWDPDDSDYGARGGRIYCTALATLTLEVYYRFLRLYDEPKLPPTAPRADDPVRRRTLTPSSPIGRF